MQGANLLRATFRNPFTGEDKIIHIEGEADLIASAELEAAKQFIKEHIRGALSTELVLGDSFLKEKLQYLMVQMYQPSSFIQLYTKLSKFHEHLKAVPEFMEVYNQYLVPEKIAPKESRIVKCLGCSSQYAVPLTATVGDRFWFYCPYCKSQNWEETPDQTVKTFHTPQ